MFKNMIHDERKKYLIEKRNNQKTRCQITLNIIIFLYTIHSIEDYIFRE